jgi:bifunctional non-homologous end joining protein LigD
LTRPALTSLDRVLWPAVGFTKGDMLAYYEAIAPVLLPHLAGRPLTLGRFPAGVDGPGFATTECRRRPDWVSTVARPATAVSASPWHPDRQNGPDPPDSKPAEQVE